MIPFISPNTGLPLKPKDEHLESTTGERFPIIDDIPRFVTSEDYAAPFGLEWKRHPKTQLDSFSGTNISRMRLEHCLGMPISELKGSDVLEAGCGAGRFTELLVDAGANVHSFDLSKAVEVNKYNIGDRPNYAISQASLAEPPYPEESFDTVISLGVLQHTPVPEQSITALWRMVKPGGRFVFDHYAPTLSLVTKLAPLYRLYLRKLPPEKAKKITDKLVDIFFPIHWAVRDFFPAQMLLSRISPCLVYFRAFPQLTKQQHKDWCRLDTFDSNTDIYKHIRTARSIRKLLQTLGAKDIVVLKGTLLEARCVKPL